MSRNAEFKQPDWRLCQEGQKTSFPISHIKPFARGNATEPAHLTLACVLLPPAGNWVRFPCSIPRLFVLSHNIPMINTTGKLASFWRFSLTAGSLPSASLATMLSPHAPRRHPPWPAGSGRAQTLPRWLLPSTNRHQPPNCQSVKDRTGPDFDERPLHI